MERAILFDLDQTLLDRDKAVEEFAKAQHAHHHLQHVPLELYCTRFRALDEHGYGDKHQLFQALINEFHLLATVEALVAEFRQYLWDNCRVFPDTIETLETLRLQGYKLGIVTNGTFESQQSKFNASGLSNCVDVIVISEQEGFKKPHPVLFTRAAERLGVSAAHCIFVGDNPRTDICGAVAAGMKTIWLENDLPWPTDLGIAPDYQIRQLREILALGLFE